MKTEKELKEIYDLIGWFNDGLFMNQDYRKGLMDAFSYALYNGERLEVIKKFIENWKKDTLSIKCDTEE